MDYHAILGLEKNATPEQIKKAYHKLARQHHPDKNSGTEEEFKKISEAYLALSKEPERLEVYFEDLIFGNGRIPEKSWPGRVVGQYIIEPVDRSGTLSFKDGILYYKNRVNIFQALLGVNEERVIIPGEAPIRISHPDPVTPWSQVIIPGKGLYDSNGVRGTLVVLFEVEFPRVINPIQREFLKACLINQTHFF